VKFKEKLSLQLTLTLAVLLLVVMVAIYLFTARYRTRSFYEKLDERAITTAQFYLAEDNLSKDNFQSVVKKYPQSLNREVIRIYTDQFVPQFISEGSVKWPKSVLQAVIAKKKVHLKDGNRYTTGIYYVDNSGNFIIMITAADEAGYRYLGDLRLMMVASFLILLLINYLLGRVFSKMALEPIVDITNNLKRVRASNLDQRLFVSPPKYDEIDNLSLTINQLLEHLQQSFEGQQRFIANASHELRTPITTIMGEAEVALISRRTEEQYRDVLTVVVKEADRLSMIIQSLMELIQTTAMPSGFQDVDLYKLVLDIVGDYERDKVKIEHLSTDENHTSMVINGNVQLLYMAINNVIKNGLKFSAGQPVTCLLYHDVDGIHLQISDKGIGIADKDIANLFQPFYRANNALGYDGFGIGLSLTDKIIKLHNGTISIHSILARGTTFHITFAV